MESDNARTLRIVNSLAFIAAIVVNVLADMLPIGGIKTADISKAYPNLFNPAEFTFSIWGAIYLLTAGFVLYQAGIFGKKGGDSADMVRRVGGWFIASCIFNIAWMYFWHYDRIFLATIMMVALLISLIAIKQRTEAKDDTAVQRWFVQAPFSLYFGWITVATIANVCVLLVKLGWNGWGISPEIWTAVVLIVGVIIAIAAILRNHDWVYGLAVLWAYAGILVRHISMNGYDMAYSIVIAVAAICELALLVATITAIKRSREDLRQEEEAARRR